jgi:hypothetical protein
MSAATATVITSPCIVCGEKSKMEVSVEQYINWRNGELIQVAFPDMSADDRELLKTGTHPECWEKMFPEKEES